MAKSKKAEAESEAGPAKQPLITRRQALQAIGATVTVAAVSTLFESGPLSADAIEGLGRTSAANPAHQWSMAIDLQRCIGCQYCLWSCQAVNDVPDDGKRWNVGFPEMTESGAEFYMTRPCLHCAEAPCVKVCPVGATWIREDGIVAMDYERCIGCRYCEVACPYDVRRFNWGAEDEDNIYTPTWGTPEVAARPRGVVEKCTFCVHRIDRGLAHGLTPGVDPQATPACVNVCPVGARVFGDANDPESPVSRFLAQHETFVLREDFGTRPRVHYVRPEKEEQA